MALTKAHNRMIEGSVVNVLDYGALGNGVADDTSAIQLALNVGGKVYFPEGAYLCTTLNIASNYTHIFGSKGSKIKLKDSTDNSVINIGSYDYVTISDIYIDGNKANQTVDVGQGISGDGSSNVLIKNCVIENTGSSGINIRNASGVKIVNNSFQTCGTMNSVNSGDAIYLAFNSNDYVSGNTIISPARIGIVLKGSTGYTSDSGSVIGNYIYGSGENAISTEDGNANIFITDNIIKETGQSPVASTKSGIAIGEVSHKLIVSNNTIEDPGSSGIEMVRGSGTETIISDNRIFDASYGIYGTTVSGAEKFDNLLISNNIIDTTGSDGLVLTASSGNANEKVNIVGNSFKSTGRHGINVQGLLDFNVSNNAIYNTTLSTGYGMQIVSSNDGSVSNNYIANTLNRGLWIRGGSTNNVAVKNNTLINCKTYGIWLSDCDNASVMGNTIRNESGGTATTTAIRSDGAGNSNLIVNNDTRGVGTGVSSAVTGTADTTTPNFT